jgi:hypothetical protein
LFVFFPASFSHRPFTPTVPTTSLSFWNRWKDAWRERLNDAEAEAADSELESGKDDMGMRAAKERGPPVLPPLRTETKNLLLRRPEKLRPTAPFLILIAKTMCLGRTRSRAG